MQDEQLNILDKIEARKLFLAVMITSFIGPFAGAGISVAIPAIGADFGASAEELSQVVFLFLVGSAMFVLPTGKVADIFGRKKVYFIGLWLFALSFAVAAFSYSVNMLNWMRFVQGCIMSLIFGPGMALLVSSHSPKERGRIIGYSAAATYSGLSLGPVICGFLVESVGWRSIFILTSLAVLVSISLLRSIKAEWYGDKGARLDLPGSMCFLFAAPMILYGLSQITSDHSGLWCLLTGAILMVIFWLIESRVEHPCLDVNLFKGNLVFTFSNLTAMLHYSGTFALSFLLSLYLQVIQGFSASHAGMIILLQPVFMALLSPKAGALSDRIAPGKVASVGMAMTCMGLFGMSRLTETTPIWYVCLVLIWIGVGFALFSSPNNNAIMGSIAPKFYGTASSLLATMRLFGQSTSMAVVTMLMAYCHVQSLTGGDNARLLEAIQTAFLVASLFSITGIFMSLARNKQQAR